jgi:predicted RNase H-like HicB family nuclease
MQYFCKLTPDTGGLTVTFRDVPEALTQGHNVDEALENASDALMTALEFYFESRVKVPESTSGKRSEHAVNLPALISAKVALHNEIVRTKKLAPLRNQIPVDVSMYRRSPLEARKTILSSYTKIQTNLV